MLQLILMIAAYTQRIQRSTQRCRQFEKSAAPSCVITLEMQNHKHLIEQRDMLIASLSGILIAAEQTNLEVAA